MGKSLEALSPDVHALAQQLLDRCLAAGLPLTVEDTDRDESTQQANLAAGRSWTKNSLHLPQSPDNKARAIDVLPTVLLSVKYWGWHGTLENSDPRWKQMGEIGESLGFAWGGRWPINPPHSRPDPGHFELHHSSNVEDVITAAAEG